MKLLEQKIMAEGKVYPGDVLKVGSFLNHKIDVDFLCKVGEEFYHLFKDCDVNKILTIEASGIGVACLTAQFFHCPVLFAKKAKTSNLSDKVYEAMAHSYTHNTDHVIRVSSEYLTKEDRVLIVDDFLANGSALSALIELCKKAGATVVGCGIVIEKAYQDGGNLIRGKGIRVESLARIASMSPEDGIKFC